MWLDVIADRCRGDDPALEAELAQRMFKQLGEFAPNARCRTTYPSSPFDHEHPRLNSLAAA
jgi:hypothetical protein